MKKKSLVMMLGSLALVGTIMVGATLAYFTDTTQAVTNTFTVGANVGIELLEDVTQDSANQVYISGYAETDGKMVVTASENKVVFQKMYPALELNKKPYIQKDDATSDCFVRIKVTGIDEMISAGFTITPNTGVGQWVKVLNEDSTTPLDSTLDGTYQYETKLTGTDTTPYLFEKVMYNSSENGVFTPAEQTALSTGIKMNAYAIQADGFEATPTETVATVAFGSTSEFVY